ncbi:unnamed protein product, partial [Nesidiocoris tenuis]
MKAVPKKQALLALEALPVDSGNRRNSSSDSLTATAPATVSFHRAKQVPTRRY